MSTKCIGCDGAGVDVDNADCERCQGSGEEFDLDEGIAVA